MLRMAMLNKISDDVKLVRFVDKKGMQLSVGNISAGHLRYSFPLQLLSYFRQCEGIAADANEGTTTVDLGENKGSGRIHTCNDALISSWSVWDGASHPWISLADSTFAKNSKERPFAIVSTVSKVKKQMQIIAEKINHAHHDKFSALLMNAIYGLVKYYPPKGLPLNEWNKKIREQTGIDLPTILNLFYKPELSSSGERHDAERECRFALLLTIRDFKLPNGDLINSIELARKLIYYELYGDVDSHYIEQVLTYVCENDSCLDLPIPDLLSKKEIA